MDRAKIHARVVVLLVAVTLLGILLSCQDERRIVVASKNFTEQVILGEMIALYLEHRLKNPVDRRLNLGGTLLAHQALINGDVDLYPEYTGTALTAVLKLSPSPDPVGVLKTVREHYGSRWGIEWLNPFGFNDTFAIVIRGEDARREGITTISDASKRTRGWKFGMGYEFQQRPDGLDGLMKTYNLALDGSIKTMDLGLLYRALEQGQVNMLAANSTDGLLSVLDVRVLEDDKQYFPPYEAAIAVRSEALKAFPGLEDALKALSGTLSEETMQKLNYEVDGKHRPVRDVAREFLQTARLIS